MTTVAFCLLSLVGYVVARTAVPSSRLTAATMSALIGLLIWGLVLYAALIAGVRAPFQKAAWLVGFGGLVALSIGLRQQPLSRDDLLFVALPCAVIAIVFNVNSLGTNVGDAGYMIMMGVDIGRFETFPEDVKHYFLYSFPLLLPLYQATVSYLQGPDQFVNVAPVLAILLMIFLAVLFRNARLKWSISLLLVVMLFSSHAMIIHSFYFNHHLIVGFMILAFAYLVEAYRQNKKTDPLPTLIVLIMGFSLVRVEGALLAIILMVVFLRGDVFSRSQRFLLAVCNAVAASARFGYLLTFQPLTWTDILHLNVLWPTAAKLIVLLVWIHVFYVAAVGRNRIIDKLDGMGSWLVRLFAVIAVLSALVLTPSGFLTSVLAIGANLFGLTGLWGLTWWLLVPALVALLLWSQPLSSEPNTELANINGAAHRRRAEGLLLDDPRFGFIVAFLALMLFFVAMRSPYRIGFGDTFSRGMLHVLPLWVWLVVDRWQLAHFDWAGFWGSLGRLRAFTTGTSR